MKKCATCGSPECATAIITLLAVKAMANQNVCVKTVLAILQGDLSDYIRIRTKLCR